MVLKKVVGIVGSPRKGKLTDQVVTKCLEGVISEGVECEKIYLIDYQIPCYTEQAKCPEELNVLCEKADALVIGAPGYWGGINGLTKDFMDIVKISNSNGKYGLGISVAGGTGRGLCSALQNIYRFFYHRSIRAIDPTPVSRFNFNLAVETLYKSGKKLAKLPLKKTPFKGNEDRITYYEKLDYLNYNYTDEMLFLAGQLVQISKDNPNFQNAEEEYESAKSLIRQGKRIKALKYIIKAYNALYFDPPEE